LFESPVQERFFKAADEADTAIHTKKKGQQCPGRSLEENYPALAVATGKIADLIPELMQLPDPRYGLISLRTLHHYASHLAESGEYVPAAISAAKVVARHAPPGSDIEQQAVSLWSKHAEVVSEAEMPQQHHRAVGPGIKLTLKM
jgi:hypothetical protein